MLGFTGLKADCYSRSVASFFRNRRTLEECFARVGYADPEQDRLATCTKFFPPNGIEKANVEVEMLSTAKRGTSLYD